MRSLSTLLLLFAISPIAIPQGNTVHDSLTVVWGQKNYSGPADCSGNAIITSTDSTLVITVNVVDDKLVLRDDSLHSDHIELWFAIPDFYHPDYRPDDWQYEVPQRTSYLWDGEKYLYLFKGKVDLKGIQRELRSPTIYAFNYSEEHPSYDALEANDNGWLKGEIDNYLAGPRSSTLRQTRLFYGITHLGVFPASRKIILYDREGYVPLEKMLGARIPDLSRFAACTSTVRPDGYRVVINLRPEALGFSSAFGLTRLTYTINIADADDSGRQETILSTSPNHRWGDPTTFKYAFLYPCIRVNLSSQIPEAGDPSQERFSDDEHLPISRLPKHFLYTADGWIPVERRTDSFEAYDQPEVFHLDNIGKVTFERGVLKARRTKRGNDMLTFLTVPQGEFMFVGKRITYPTRDTVATFLLADSSVAVLATKFEASGMYTHSYISYLVLAAGASETVLGEFWNNESMSFSDSLKFEAKDWDRYRVNWDDMESEKNFKWASIFFWERPGRSMVIDLGRGIRVRISWDDRGNNITYTRL
jgi:hypothetical protein